MRRIVFTVVGTLVVLALLGLGVVFTGVYDVSADTSHMAVTRWVLHTAMEKSVSSRASSVTGAPPTDPDRLAHGLEHYDAMCVSCHGAPGVERGESGQGLMPEPPELHEELEEWSDAELFWITKHGIRMSGMPAFGPTHSDDEIWAIVGFLKELEGMTPAEYASRVEALRAPADSASGEEEGHTHAPGTPAHSH